MFVEVDEMQKSKRDQLKSESPTPVFEPDEMNDKKRSQYLLSQIESLGYERNWLCERFLAKKCSVEEICIALDLIGKKAVEFYLMATVF